MRARAKKLIKHPLFSGSAIMVIGTNFGNFFAYLYHVVMGRILGPASYGDLASTISLLGIIGTVFTFFGLVVVKYVSSIKKDSELAGIYSWFSVKAWYIGIAITLLVFLLSGKVANFLHVETKTIMIIAPVFVLSMISSVYKSFLQGLLRFGKYITVTNSDIIGRLIFGLVFVYLGLNTTGALLGIVLSVFFGAVLGRIFLRDIREAKETAKFEKVRELVSYAIPVFVASASIFSFFATDVILVKHFFTSYDAGIYASISNLGKIIFYAASPVTSVMFPMVSQRKSEGKNYTRIFLLGAMLTSVVSVGVLTVYWLFPEKSISVLFGTEYLEASVYLVGFAIFMSVFTLAAFIINYYMSLGKKRLPIWV